MAQNHRRRLIRPFSMLCISILRTRGTKTPITNICSMGSRTTRATGGEGNSSIPFIITGRFTCFQFPFWFFFFFLQKELYWVHVSRHDGSRSAPSQSRTRKSSQRRPRRLARLRSTLEHELAGRGRSLGFAQKKKCISARIPCHQPPGTGNYEE